MSQVDGLSQLVEPTETKWWPWLLFIVIVVIVVIVVIIFLGKKSPSTDEPTTRQTTLPSGSAGSRTLGQTLNEPPSTDEPTTRQTTLPSGSGSRTLGQTLNESPSTSPFGDSDDNNDSFDDNNDPFDDNNDPFDDDVNDTNLEGYVFVEGKDSIQHEQKSSIFPDYGIIYTDPYPLCEKGKHCDATIGDFPDLNYLKDWCDWNQDCAGFTPDGRMRYYIRPQENLMDPENPNIPGIYVKNTGYTFQTQNVSGIDSASNNIERAEPCTTTALSGISCDTQELMNKCDNMGTYDDVQGGSSEGCAGFNSQGYLKTKIKNPKLWTRDNADGRSPGFWIKNPMHLTNRP